MPPANGTDNFLDPSRTVKQYTKDGRYIRSYDSLLDAANDTGIDHSTICRCVNGKRSIKTAGGYIWTAETMEVN